MDDAHSVFIKLDDNTLVHRWLPMFNRAVQCSTIDQTSCFLFRISKEQALTQLRQAAININQFLKHSVVPTVDDSWHRSDICNRIHLVFEQLHGSFEEPTKLFICAPQLIKQSIRDLNFYVHVLEQQDYEQKNLWYINFDRNSMERQALDELDYELFQHHMTPGLVFLHYAELGKTHAELYADGLPADYAGQKNLHYLGADISIWLGDTVDYFRPGFKNWAQENNIDYTDKRLGLGILPVGHLLDLDHARELIYNASKISQLRIHHG